MGQNEEVRVRALPPKVAPLNDHVPRRRLSARGEPGLLFSRGIFTKACEQTKLIRIVAIPHATVNRRHMIELMRPLETGRDFRCSGGNKLARNLVDDRVDQSGLSRGRTAQSTSHKARVLPAPT
jgi:hypothetical protein